MTRFKAHMWEMLVLNTKNALCLKKKCPWHRWFIFPDKDESTLIKKKKKKSAFKANALSQVSSHGMHSWYCKAAGLLPFQTFIFSNVSWRAPIGITFHQFIYDSTSVCPLSGKRRRYRFSDLSRELACKQWWFQSRCCTDGQFDQNISKFPRKAKSVTKGFGQLPSLHPKGILPLRKSDLFTLPRM